MNNQGTVVAVYDSYETADKAIRALVEEGFARSDIGLAANNTTGAYNNLATSGVTDLNTEPSDVSGGEGGSFGAVVGGITGAVVALSAIVIPGIGPIIAAGPLVALLGGATGAVVGGAAGAVTGGVAASLIHLGIPEEEAHHYVESVRRGNAMVTVQVTNDEDGTTASNVLRRYNPVDVKGMADQWRERGWSGFDPNAEPYREEDLVKERELTTSEREMRKEADAIRRYPPVSPLT
jgi:hypothetical protein